MRIDFHNQYAWRHQHTQIDLKQSHALDWYTLFSVRGVTPSVKTNTKPMLTHA